MVRLASPRRAAIPHEAVVLHTGGHRHKEKKKRVRENSGLYRGEVEGGIPADVTNPKGIRSGPTEIGSKR